MRRLVVGPFNRVEGDLEVRLDIDAGAVTSARVVSPMFRGFEAILEGRPPDDALVLAPRICGICSVSQSMAASSALAQAQGLTAPPNGRRAALLAHACENLSDHLTHFFLFFAPDFARQAYGARAWSAEAQARFAAPSGASRTAALAARAKFLHVTGIVAGKWPHTLALQAGGSTLPLDHGAKIRLIAAIDDFRRYLEAEVYAGALEVFAEIGSLEALQSWRAAARGGALRFFLDIADDLDLWRAGRGAEVFLSYGAYADEGLHALAPGVWRAGAVVPLDTQAIIEDSAHAFYAGAPAHPAAGSTRAQPEKQGAYSWCRAPRYGGEAAEVGAFARQLVDGNALTRELHARFGSTVSGRVLARWIEVARVLPWMERWARAITVNEPYLIAAPLPQEADAVGLVEAARGALGHWLGVRAGVIERYQIIAPTTWNFSPRDAEGIPGPLERALVGAPVGAGETTPLAVQHIVRSFDPCMVCTAH